MAERSIEERVALLENELRGLPERLGALEMRVASLDGQFQQFRIEVGDEFAAVRREFREQFSGHEDSIKSDLRREIREGDEETRRLMRVLYEDLVARISLISRG